jgi:hypothetical protein
MAFEVLLSIAGVEPLRGRRGDGDAHGSCITTRRASSRCQAIAQLRAIRVRRDVACDVPILCQKNAGSHTDFDTSHGFIVRIPAP